jgi:c(7)-type cytochrome triheme protein
MKILVAILALAALAGLALAALAGAALAWRQPVEPVRQPMAMSHKRHSEAEMKCRACHQGVEGNARAGLPTLADCMDCHDRPQGHDPAEPEVREWARRGQEIPWVRLNRLPGHVYFSHAAHVTLAELACEDCHRDMKVVTAPLTEPDVELDMRACIACHRARQASVECVACHR